MVETETEKKARASAKEYADQEVKKYNFLQKFMKISLFRKIVFLIGVYLGIGLVFGWTTPTISGPVGFVLALGWITLVSYFVVVGGFYDIFYFKKKKEFLEASTKKS